MATTNPLHIEAPSEAAIGRLEKGPIQPWHVVGGVGEPSYQLPWAPRAGEPVLYRKTPEGLVEVVGAADYAGTPTGSNINLDGTVFTLPPGYRPDAVRVFTAYYYEFYPGSGGSLQQGHNWALLYVFPDGQVYIDGRDGARGALAATLNEIRFYLRGERV